MEYLNKSYSFGFIFFVCDNSPRTFFIFIPFWPVAQLRPQEFILLSWKFSSPSQLHWIFMLSILCLSFRFVSSFGVEGTCSSKFLRKDAWEVNFWNPCNITSVLTSPLPLIYLWLDKEQNSRLEIAFPQKLENILHDLPSSSILLTNQVTDIWCPILCVQLVPLSC